MNVFIRHEELPFRVGRVVRRPRPDSPNGSRTLVAQLRHARDLVWPPQIRPGAPLRDGDVRAQAAMQRPASETQKHADVDRRPHRSVSAAICAFAIRREPAETVERGHVFLLVAFNELARVLCAELGLPHDLSRVECSRGAAQEDEIICRRERQEFSRIFLGQVRPFSQLRKMMNTKLGNQRCDLSVAARWPRGTVLAGRVDSDSAAGVCFVKFGNERFTCSKAGVLRERKTLKVGEMIPVRIRSIDVERNRCTLELRGIGWMNSSERLCSKGSTI